MQRRRPETIRQHDDAGRIGSVVLRPDQAAEHRVKAHHLKVRTANHARLNLPWLAQANHGEANGGEVAERTQGLDVGT